MTAISDIIANCLNGTIPTFGKLIISFLFRKPCLLVDDPLQFLMRVARVLVNDRLEPQEQQSEAHPLTGTGGRYPACDPLRLPTSLVHVASKGNARSGA